VQVYAPGSHLIRLWFAAVLDDFLGARHCSTPVDSKSGDSNPEFVEPLRKCQNFGDPDQGLFGYSPIIQSSAAETVALNYSHTRTSRRRSHGRRTTGGATADD
jgi:7-cyano-7-deazaguanine synthase in queuosine biosynthesis